MESGLLLMLLLTTQTTAVLFWWMEKDPVRPHQTTKNELLTHLKTINGFLKEEHIATEKKDRRPSLTECLDLRNAITRQEGPLSPDHQTKAMGKAHHTTLAYVISLIQYPLEMYCGLLPTNSPKTPRPRWRPTRARSRKAGPLPKDNGDPLTKKDDPVPGQENDPIPESKANDMSLADKFQHFLRTVITRASLTLLIPASRHLFPPEEFKDLQHALLILTSAHLLHLSALARHIRQKGLPLVPPPTDGKDDIQRHRAHVPFDPASDLDILLTDMSRILQACISRYGGNPLPKPEISLLKAQLVRRASRSSFRRFLVQARIAIPLPWELLQKRSSRTLALTLRTIRNPHHSLLHTLFLLPRIYAAEKALSLKDF